MAHQKAEIAKLIQYYGLDNISLLPEQPREVIPSYLSAADVALIPLRKLEIFKGALPSKLFDAWACQRPVLLSVEGEARQILEEANGGVFVPPEDASALARAILNLKGDSAAREAMGRSGRAFTEQHYSRETLALRLFEVISG